MRNSKILSHLLMVIYFIPTLTDVVKSDTNPFASKDESYQNLTYDGAWCWFSDPRATYFAGAKKSIYAGWVNQAGDIGLSAIDLVTGKIDTAILHPKFNVDDHANPAVLCRPDGHLMVFYSRHNARQSPLYLRISKRPEDLREWEPEQALWLNDNPAYASEYSRNYCYTNVCQLAAEKNKIYLFWRGIGAKPCASTSVDGGKTWVPGQILILPDETYPDRRPYVKFSSNDRAKIHFAFTDGHPRNETTNSIYYACYRNGALYRANGKKIADWIRIPIKPRQADLVYDATQTNVRAWIWDVAEDEQGNPVIVYTRLPAEDDHRYHYARWDGKKWLDQELCPAGKWFPQTPDGDPEVEPHYSGGIVLDQHHPAIVYLSRPVNGIFEIEKWTSPDQGKSWRTEAITTGSQHSNVRPCVVKNYPPGKAPSLFWLNIRKYLHYTRFETAIKMNIPWQPLTPDLEPTAIFTALQRVADWQLANPSPHPLTDWTHGALFTGLTAWALMAGDAKYLNALRNFAERNQWRLGDRTYHADDHCVGHTYLELYRQFHDPKMIQSLQKQFDYILQHPSPVSLKFGEQKNLDRWWWCDALFMSPPVWASLAALTGNQQYLDFMNSEFWATTDYLYDQTEHLFFRDDRYFTPREANGKKICWSRGNGWVFAGLARVLENMPLDFADRPRYVQLFKEMAAKLAAIQPPDGLWRPSLLDPDSYPHPETSGSGFFCFALAWGINQGLLAPEVYLPVVKNAWTGLVQAVHLDGKLGSVQPIGADPKQVHADQTEIYGVGAFLLAGSEVYKLAWFQQLPKVTVSITNPLAIFRPQETVTLHWNDLQKFLPAISPENVAVFATKNNQFLMTQNLNDPARRQNDLLFQADWAPNETRIFRITPQPKNFSPPRSDSRTFAMFVPQRKEDFAWENDRIAFRMYGKALESETVSSGIDVWVKRVAYPVLEKWYQTDDYHVEHGEGLDFYKVGPTRGCGGLAIWKDGKLIGSRNFRRWKIIANGPIRSVFELEYDPWEAGALKIREVKRIALDLGSNLNHIESSFYTDAPAPPFEVAIGLVKVQNDGAMTYHLKQGWLGYWQPADPVNGVIGCGIVVPGENLKFLDHDGHGLLVTTAAPGAPLVYYAGAGWSKTKLFPERASWTRYLEEYALRIANPLTITINLSK